MVIISELININDLRKVSGIGEKTIQRVRDRLLNKDEEIYESSFDKEIELTKNNIFKGDCLQLMKWIPDKSIDMVLCDLPYGTTKCKWDTIIPFSLLWKHYERTVKDDGAIILFGSQPFTSQLVASNINLFKYEIIWNKVNISNPMLAKKQVLKSHENILIFYKKQPTYNPQMTVGTKWKRGGSGAKYSEHKAYGIKLERECKDDKTNLKYPKSIITFSNANRTNVLHPTQKPVELFEWLINTYSNENDLVLDNCIGSGTTAIASMNANRNYIGIEKESEYYNLAKGRVNKHIMDNNLQDEYNVIA